MRAKSANELESQQSLEVRKIVESKYLEVKTRLEKQRRLKIIKNVLNNSFHDSDDNKGQCSNLMVSCSNAMRNIPSLGKRVCQMKPVDRPPSGLAWVRVHTNMRAPETFEDNFFVPYLGESDAHQNFSNKIAADNFPTEPDAEDDNSDVESELDLVSDAKDDLFVSNFPPLPKEKRKDRITSRKNGVVSSHNASLIQHNKWSKPVWDRAVKRVALEEASFLLGSKWNRTVVSIICDVFGIQSSAQVSSYYKNISYRRAKYKEKDVMDQQKEAQKKEMLSLVREESTSTPSRALLGDSIPFFFCRQCYSYNCLLHGNQTAKPNRVLMDRTRKDASSKVSEAIENQCEDRDVGSCWCVSPNEVLCTTWWREVRQDSDDIKAIILELFKVFGMDSCRISAAAKLFFHDEKRLFHVSCNRVGYLLSTLDEVESYREASQFPRRPRKKSSKISRMRTPAKEVPGMEGGRRVDFVPCQHEGPCTLKTCRCVENGVNCEKFCCCSHTRSYNVRPEKRTTCTNAFQGCTCKSAVACVSNACVCFSWRRECDPDLCRACHDCKENGKRNCRNVGLLMGERQRTVVGHSETHGWGAFSVDKIMKNDIIGEYVGEIVNQVDAERRGTLYDEIDYSFLFNTTEEFALDSTRLGNKLRYCNHHFIPNCEARLMRVGGDIRVGLYALKDIRANEELFFDYKYKNGPSWAMPGNDTKPKKNKKVASAAKKRAFIEWSGEEEGDEDEDFNEYECSESNDDKVVPVQKKRQKVRRGSPSVFDLGKPNNNINNDAWGKVKDKTTSGGQSKKSQKSVWSKFKPTAVSGASGSVSPHPMEDPGIGLHKDVKSTTQVKNELVYRGSSGRFVKKITLNSEKTSEKAVSIRGRSMSSEYLLQQSIQYREELSTDPGRRNSSPVTGDPRAESGVLVGKKRQLSGTIEAPIPSASESDEEVIEKRIRNNGDRIQSGSSRESKGISKRGNVRSSKKRVSRDPCSQEQGQEVPPHRSGIQEIDIYGIRNKEGSVKQKKASESRDISGSMQGQREGKAGSSSFFKYHQDLNGKQPSSKSHKSSLTRKIVHTSNAEMSEKTKEEGPLPSSKPLRIWRSDSIRNSYGSRRAVDNSNQTSAPNGSGAAPVPLVNLISDDDNKNSYSSSSSSYEPNIYNWLR